MRGPRRISSASVRRVKISVYMIEVIRNCLTLLGISTFWQGAFVGAAIVLAVAFDSLRNVRQSD